ncbi:hypothetical protein C0993_003342 [Termitomyces sp. T159_Od127]|nr:hypothetical protein C0993_003342 [Termitomyces sp. T159_Od127]
MMSTPSDFNFPDFSTLSHVESNDDFFQYSKFQPTRGQNNSLNSYELYNAIANTTLNNLMNTCNHAYLKLLDTYNQSQADHDHVKSELNHLQTELTHLCELTTKLANAAVSQLAPPQTSAPQTQQSAPLILNLSMLNLPEMAKRADHPNVKIREQTEWKRKVERCKNKGEHLDKLGFLTDSDGIEILKVHIKQITEGTKMLWNEMKQHSITPGKWKKKTNRAKAFFMHHMLKDFIEF